MDTKIENRDHEMKRVYFFLYVLQNLKPQENWRERTDNGDGGLSARVSARIHKHRHEEEQNRRQCRLKAAENRARKGCRHHKKEQPRHAREKERYNRGPNVGGFGGGDTRHLSEVLLGFLTNDVDSVVDGDYADESGFTVNHGQSDKAVAVKEKRNLLRDECGRLRPLRRFA